MSHIAREILLETSSQVLDATTFLSMGDKELVNLFGDYECAQSITEKQQVVEKISTALMINLQIEEEIFHPAVKKILSEKGIISAAIMNHSILKYLVSEIGTIDVDSDIYDVKVRVLGEHLKQHIREKQGRLFPKIKASGKICLWALGAQLAARKEDLLEKNIDLRS